MESRRIVIILGRERDFEPGEFGLQFSLGGLGDEGQSARVLAAILELLVAKTGFAVFDEGVPADRNCNLSVHVIPCSSLQSRSSRSRSFRHFRYKYHKANNRH